MSSKARDKIADGSFLRSAWGRQAKHDRGLTTESWLREQSFHIKELDLAVVR
ncbi:MAG: hypothetical protein ACOY0T_18320 [Myxococcota bacterium]